MRGRSRIFGLAALVLAAWADLAHAAEKTLTYGLYNEPDTLDSVKMITDGALHPAWLICDSLLNLTKDGRRLEPGLAKSWTLTADGRLATLKIRAGVLFHDGTPVDAEAVRVSVERHFEPTEAGEPVNTREQMLRKLIEGVQVLDALTVTFRLKSYGALHYLSQVDIVSPAAVARLGKDFGRQPVCSGPFKFESWLRGDRLTVVANDRYWRGRPRLDRVVFRFINETAVLADAIARGDVDFIPHVVDPAQFERIRDGVGARLVLVPSLNVTYLGFDMERAPFNDPRVRRAVVQAIDRARLTLILGRGAATPANGPLMPMVRGHDSAVRQAAHDPAAARRVLAAIGAVLGPPVKLVHHDGYAIHAEVAGAIQSDLARAGLSVELVGKPRLGDVVTAIRRREGELFVSAWNVRGPYPERVLFPLFHSGWLGVTNLVRNRSAQLDALLEEALRVPDEAAQRRIYSRAQQLIVGDAPAVFLYHGTRIAAVQGHVRNLEMNLSALPYDKLLRVDLRP